MWVCVGMGGGIETVQPCPVAEPTASSLPQSRHLLGQLSATAKIYAPDYIFIQMNQ